ncbi:hypothetical protein CPB83DRAFT_848440 [Crepidotus variabilis]|uniref:Uncharacterized protein n=1 Tax=Crepidotus variabilis TaxID=179855 RepID=A0A9P6JSR6_9AGAR|nr:hypothetical protein CPB83DRAFT_848440 [Crepidotus variabilis]
MGRSVLLCFSPVISHLVLRMTNHSECVVSGALASKNLAPSPIGEPCRTRSWTCAWDPPSGVAGRPSRAFAQFFRDRVFQGSWRVLGFFQWGLSTIERAGRNASQLFGVKRAILQHSCHAANLASP